jgi:beta-galactosidase
MRRVREMKTDYIGTSAQRAVPDFLVSGEVHYFRLDAECWQTHLSRLKDAGANTVSTYVPWDWHEYAKGAFDFDGATHPARNLRRFIALCAQAGLRLILKPGPYILAEYEAQGLPGWLAADIGESAFARDETGAVIRPDVFTYLSDKFLERVFGWYDAVLPVIRENQASQGGPVICMQVCNEVGIFQWLYGKVDYNPAAVTLYRGFIEEKYQTVRALNSMYETQYMDFQTIAPPAGRICTRGEFAAYYDFHLFYRWYFARYFDTLITKIRSVGIEVGLTHNIPGWIYGGAAEMPMLMSTYADVMKRGDVWFGLDHIPEYFSYRNVHCGLACNRILRAMQNAPVWAAEFQAGTREHHVKCDADDMRAFYYASLAHGLKGLNFYMFSQGKNPGDKGYFGKTFYYQTALDSAGDPLPLYDVIGEVSRFIRDESEGLSQAEADADVCVGLYKPYFFTELVSSHMLGETKLDTQALGLTVDPRMMREDLWFNGLLRALQTLNFNYDVRDLEDTDVGALLSCKQLWMICADYMDRRTQTLLAEYAARGGHLIISPVIPTLDEYLRPCRVLADALGIHTETAEGQRKAEAFGIADIYTHTTAKQVYRADGAAIVASSGGVPCGVVIEHGRGRVTALGFSIGYSSDEHLRLYETLLRQDRIGRDAEVSDPEIQFVVQRSGEQSYLFLINPHNSARRFTADGIPYTLKPFSCLAVRR